MGQRLTKIYTRTGDRGDTGLGDGQRVAKDDARIEALGAVDELNSLIGLVLSETDDASIKKILTDIQHQLFELGGELSLPGKTLLQESWVETLEHRLDELNQPLGSLKDFILPGGHRAAALCHLARSVCRRAERRLYTLSRSSEITTVSLSYLNRLSDLLFVIARSLNQKHGYADVLWKHDPSTD
ncbi:MAG TPA: cob(I)yrinic acid a,c-diamide adenosyltransferase [Acidiferrobacteraceae bacterium]|nr:cob(I)yrinic acid a,c-diamide adenosyltransferase [Acidiferrobacteraceae bacterium]